MSDPVEWQGQWVWSCGLCGRAYATSHSEGFARREATKHRETGRGCPAAFADDLETYIRGGETVRTAADRRGVTVRSLEREINRLGRPDLLRRLRLNELHHTALRRAA